MDKAKTNEYFERLISSIELRYGRDLNTRKEFTKEEVEVVKNLCLTFKKHFEENVGINWNEESKSDSLQDVGYTWCKNLGSIIPQLLIYPDLMERVKAIPDLNLLVKLAERPR